MPRGGTLSNPVIVKFFTHVSRRFIFLFLNDYVFLLAILVGLRKEGVVLQVLLVEVLAGVVVRLADEQALRSVVHILDQQVLVEGGNTLIHIE